MITTIRNAGIYSSNTLRNDWSLNTQSLPITETLSQAAEKLDSQNDEKKNQLNPALVRGLWVGRESHLRRNHDTVACGPQANSPTLLGDSSFSMEQATIPQAVLKGADPSAENGAETPNQKPLQQFLNCIGWDSSQDDSPDDLAFEKLLTLFLIIMSLTCDSVKIVRHGKHVSLKCTRANSHGKGPEETFMLNLK